MVFENCPITDQKITLKRALKRRVEQLYDRRFAEDPNDQLIQEIDYWLPASVKALELGERVKLVAKLYRLLQHEVQNETAEQLLCEGQEFLAVGDGEWVKKWFIPRESKSAQTQRKAVAVPKPGRNSNSPTLAISSTTNRGIVRQPDATLSSPTSPSAGSVSPVVSASSTIQISKRVCPDDGEVALCIRCWQLHSKSIGGPFVPWTQIVMYNTKVCARMERENNMFLFWMFRVTVLFLVAAAAGWIVWMQPVSSEFRRR